jgi:hypothetical protein
MRGLIVPILLTAGCAPFAPLSGGYCAPPVTTTWTVAEDREPAAGAGRIERFAALLGLDSALVERRASAGAVSPESRLHVLERIEMARIAVAAVSAELACEAARADQAADYLTRHEATAVQRLTVASVLVAAATSVAGVLLSTSSAKAAPQDAVAIGGGALTVGLGLESLNVHSTIEFTHPRNLLADVWTGPAVSATYPPPVWGYLARSEFSNDQVQPIRERIVARWRTSGTLENTPSVVALVFGAGGSYDAATLRARAAMLDQVKAEVDLENQELAALANALHG